MGKPREPFVDLEDVAGIAFFGVIGGLVSGFFGHQAFLFYSFIYWLLLAGTKRSLTLTGIRKEVIRFVCTLAMGILAVIIGVGIEILRRN